MTLSFFACKEKATKNVSKTFKEQNQSNLTNDAAELEKLTKELYKWNETKSSQVDFDPIKKEKDDLIYTRIDLARHKQRLNELKETDFFTDYFIQNYNNIALTIDEKMVNKSFVYYVGELPPYGNDANPWCNCQDNPDNYWGKIALKNVIINKIIAIHCSMTKNNTPFLIVLRYEVCLNSISFFSSIFPLPSQILKPQGIVS